MKIKDYAFDLVVYLKGYTLPNIQAERAYNELSRALVKHEWT